MSRQYLTSINLNKNELQNAAIQALAIAPLNPVIGQIYFDTDLNNLRTWDGSQWLDYTTIESGAGYITSVGTNLDVTDQELTLGANVVITNSSQTLSNKSISGNLTFLDGDALNSGVLYALTGGGLAANTSGSIQLTSLNGNVDLYADTGAYVNEDEIVTVSASQTLTNKTVDGVIVTGITSFRDGSNTEYVKIEQAYTGTTRITSVDDIAIRSTGGDVILYPGNDDGGTGRAYVHWGNDATGAGAGNEIATLGATQTFSNKTFLNGIDINDGTNADSSIYVSTTDLYVEGSHDLNLVSGNGDIILNADGNVYKGSVNTVNEIITQGRLDNYIGDGTVTGSTGNTITDRIATAKSEAQSYADGLVQGLNVKDSVLRMSDANIALESWNADGSFFDGVDTLQAGSRVLLTAQSTAAENGIYVIQVDGSLARAEDQPSVDKGDYTLVVEGTYAATGWIATSATAWTQFSAANEYTAGNGIDITANAISVDLDGDSLSVSGAGLKANLNTGGGLDTDSGIYIRTGTGLTIDGSNNLAFASGYGIQKYAVSNGALTATSGSVTWTITHNFGTQDVTVQMRDISTGALVEADVVLTDVNTVTISWVSGDVSANAYRVVVVG